MVAETIFQGGPPKASQVNHFDRLATQPMLLPDAFSLNLLLPLA